jgi:hypothetical protein
LDYLSRNGPGITVAVMLVGVGAEMVSVLVKLEVGELRSDMKSLEQRVNGKLDVVIEESRAERMEMRAMRMEVRASRKWW